MLLFQIHCENTSQSSAGCWTLIDFTLLTHLLIAETRICPDGMLKCGSGQCILTDDYCYGYNACRDNTWFTDANGRKC